MLAIGSTESSYLINVRSECVNEAVLGLITGCIRSN